MAFKELLLRSSENHFLDDEPSSVLSHQLVKVDMFRFNQLLCQNIPLLIKSLLPVAIHAISRASFFCAAIIGENLSFDGQLRLKQKGIVTFLKVEA